MNLTPLKPLSRKGSRNPRVPSLARFVKHRPPKRPSKKLIKAMAEGQRP